jgi:hypothetical protein
MMLATVRVTGVGTPYFLAQDGDLADDGVDSAPPFEVVVEQHRGARVRDLAAERADVLDGVADVELDPGGVCHGYGLPGAGFRDGPGAGVGHDLSDGQLSGAGRCGE